MYSENAIYLSEQFMTDDNGSYSKLADYLNLFSPRPDGAWTKHQAYHLCRTNDIRSTRRCKQQPAASRTQRTNTRQRITIALIDALSASGRTLADIAPVNLKEIATLSGEPIYNIRNNWDDLEDELNDLAGV